MSDQNQSQVLEYKILMQQMQKLQQNVGNLDEHIHELKRIQENIEALEKTSKGTETLIPVGSGLFFKGTIEETQTLLMNIGSNICVEKTSQEALHTVTKQLEDVENLITELEQEATETAQRLEELKQEMNE